MDVQNKSKKTYNSVQETEANKSLGQQAFEAVQIIGELVLLLLTISYSVGETLYYTLFPPEPKPVKGEIVLISGVGHGIGRELALLYASEGARVVGWDINKKNCDETINEINERGYVKARSYACDVSNRESVFETAKKVQEEVGDVTILINNAGIMPTHSILNQSKGDIERTFNINVLAHHWTVQAFLPAMQKINHGHIVALSSCAGLFGLENLVPYCGTKFAVRGFMEALNEELRLNKDNHIKTTTICPYMVNTGLCKKPKIRFEKLMPLLEPKAVAKAIMDSQRSDKAVITIPFYLLILTNIFRVLPVKASMAFKDFMNSGVEAE